MTAAVVIDLRSYIALASGPSVCLRVLYLYFFDYVRELRCTFYFILREYSKGLGYIQLLAFRTVQGHVGLEIVAFEDLKEV